MFARFKTWHDEMLKSKLAPEVVAELVKEGALLVDVRSRIGAILGMVPGATNIPLSVLKRHMDELPRDRNIVLYCGSGGRAGKAKQVLDAKGFKAFNGGAYKDVKKIVGAKR